VCILTAHRGWHSPGRFGQVQFNSIQLNSILFNEVEEFTKMEGDQNRVRRGSGGVAWDSQESADAAKQWQPVAPYSQAFRTCASPC
jgi:hypothetical protein